jgi:uncharacterized protein (DUF1810 family)
MEDTFDLARFVQAQDAVIDAVRCELQAGLKRTHWMWFVFPQLRALGRSPTAQRYGISSLAEARAYMAHPVLGTRLVECAELVLSIPGRTAHEIFGSPDDLKLHSSMTLFAAATPDRQVFGKVIGKFFCGTLDLLTTELLAKS